MLSIERWRAAARDRPEGRSEEFDFLGDDVGVVVGAPVALVAAVADLADHQEFVALLLVYSQRSNATYSYIYL